MSLGEEKTTKIIYSQPIQIELNKTTKGYTWSIKINAEDYQQALFLVETIDQELRQRYGEQKT